MAAEDLKRNAPEVAALVADLRAGRAVSDERFDRQVQLALRELSEVHWTPVAVCQRVMQLLDPRPDERVLDVGGGVGKPSIIGALSSPRATFLGVELQPDRVREARRLAEQLGADNAHFVCRDALAFVWREFQAIYLYNPFGELSFEDELAGDLGATAAGRAHRAAVEETRRRLATLARGTRVVTFHGFGGDMPDSFTLETVEQHAGGALALWSQG